MTAALAASRSGGKVLVLEKGREPGGNTALSTGLIPAAGTRFQHEAGIVDDTPTLMAEDIFEKNKHQSDPALTRHLCETSARLVEWLVDEVGCELICYTDFLYPGQSRFRMHGPPQGYGAELVHQLTRAVRSDPSIELRLGTPVHGLVLDGDRVVGVETAEHVIEADAVVLTLDGFGGDPEMVREQIGTEVADAPYFGSPNNVGDGVRWGVAAGAATEHMDAYQGHGSVTVPDGPLVTWGLVTNGAVLVNRHGRRFGDESRGYSEFAREVLAQPGGEAWEIFDERVHDASRGTRFEEVISAGKVVRGETPEDLAAALGLPADELALTLGSVNRAASGEEADPFGRDSFADGLSDSPFYGIHVCGALFHTQGGLRVDTSARVLRPDSSPIPGLYAGGGTAVGISGRGAEGYLAGNGLLAALGLGRIAGDATLNGGRALQGGEP
jgi:fumarate reductase flavoprotein subunit